MITQKEFLLLMAFITLSGISYSQRYLEKKDFEESRIKPSRVSQIFATLNKENTRIAITNTEIDMEKDRIRSSYYAKILNLTNGRMERRIDNSMLFFINNDLLFADFSSSAGQWQKFTEISLGEVYYLDLATNEKVRINLPPGYSFAGTQGKYYMAADYFKNRSLIGESVDGKFQTKMELPMATIKFSSDGLRVYGRDMQQGISVYDLGSGEKIKSVKITGMMIQFELLENGNVYYTTMQDSYLADSVGKVIFTFKNAGAFFSLNDSQDQALAINHAGNISLWDLNNGQLLTQTTDTYIGQEFSNKQVGQPFKISGGDFYIIPYNTGIMSVFSSKEKKVIADIFVDQDEWAVIAKDGRMDGTQQALGKLEWRVYNGKNIASRTSLESAWGKYYTPRLLYNLLSGIPAEVASSSLEQDVQKIPVLVVASVNGKPFGGGNNNAMTQKNIKLSIQSKINSSEVMEVSLYHNGKLTGLQKRNDDGVYEFSATLNTVFGEDNFFYAVAKTATGVTSEKCKLVVSYKASENLKPDLYAVIIGLNKYQNPKYNLNYALSDAGAFKEQLQVAKSALFGSIEIISLADSEVTKAAIVNAFLEVQTRIKEQDIFVFYYAGHGTMSEDPLAPEFYIVPHDVTQLYGNETLLKEKALSATDIRKLSMSLNAQKQVFLIDACHSAAALTSAATRGAAEEKAIARLARSTGTFWLTAAGSDQFATEFEQLGHGVFTYALLEVLGGKDNASITDGAITIRELSSYVERRVPELSEQYKGKPQYPSSFSFGNDFPFVVLAR